MLEAPVPTWDCDPTKLYTYSIEDKSLDNDNGFFHYLVVNIENCDVSTGDVVLDYLPSFTFFRDESGTQLDTSDRTRAHQHVHLIHEQTNEVDGTTRQSGCDTNIIGARFVSFVKKKVYSTLLMLTIFNRTKLVIPLKSSLLMLFSHQ